MTTITATNDTPADEVREIKPTRGPGRPKGAVPKEEKPRKPKKWADDPLAYHRNYYREKLMHPCSCERYGRAFTSICGYKRHKRECKTCKIVQRIREAAERGNTIAPEMVTLYKETDAIGDLLGKVISL